MTLLKNLFLSAVLVLSGANVASASDELGIFERILDASGNFDDTAKAFETALRGTNMNLQAVRDIYTPAGAQRARVFVLTSPDYMAAAAGEPANSISGQILRAAVYEYGPGRKTFINMANPVAHAYVYYGKSANSAKLLAAAKAVADEFRKAASQVPGNPVSVQLEPIRDIDALKKFNGDGPAKMMAGFANWEGNQDAILEDEENFSEVVASVEKALKANPDKGVDDHTGWTIVSKIPFGSKAVYFGITNQYTENKAISINSDFRSDGKSDDAPLPGVDHAPALPLEVLVVDTGKGVNVLQYGEMWRMQLYFWDSGYRAFAKNAIIPAKIEGSIEDAISGEGW